MGTEKSISLLSKEDIYLLGILSIFEQDFSLDWIVELVGGKATEVLSSLENFVRKGWLKRKRTGFYLFIKLNERQELQSHFTDQEKHGYHKRIATILLAESMSDEMKARAVYRHLLVTPADADACKWLKKAGDALFKDFHIEQALQCYQKVLNSISNYNSTETDVLFIDTAMQYSKISVAKNETSKVIEILKTALRKTESRGLIGQKALLHMYIAKNEWIRSQYKVSMKHFEDGRSIAENMNDDQLTQKISMFNVFFLFWQGHYKEVVGYYEKCAPEIEKFPEGRFPLWGIDLAGHCYFHIGHVAQSLGLLEALRKHAEEIGDYFVASDVVGSIGIIMVDLRNIDEALQYFEKATDLAIKGHNGWMNILGKLCLAYSNFLKGENEKAFSFIQEFLSLSSQYQVSVWPIPYLLDLCWAIEQGRFMPVPGLSLKGEIHKALMTENLFMKGLAYRYKGLLERKEGLPDSHISKSLNLSLEFLEESGSKIETAKTQIEIAYQYLMLRKEEEARTIAQTAFKTLSSYNEVLFPNDLKCLIQEETPPEEVLLDEIMKLAQEIIHVRNSRDLVLKIISTVNRLTGAERGAIFVNNQGEINLKASKNLTSMEITHPDFAPSLKLIEDVARTGNGIIITAGETEFNPSSNGVCSIICVPMKLRDEVTGVLYHDNRLLISAFKKSDLKLLDFFAAQAAIALDNVRSYEEIQLQNKKLNEEKKYFEEQYLNKIHMGDIIGDSPAIKSALNQVRQVAETDSTVLVLGETGVGKELVAGAIHQNSSRKNKPFICVQCSALPDNLIASELFGHEKGAFTGAVKQRIGRFELANGGTLFLDEIGDLPHDMQVSLLRVLQSKRFERIGGSETIQSDFRLIAATNRNLENEVKTGRFRRDLFYRLNVFPIYVPPLRERKEDIPLLAHYFLKKFSKRMGKVFENIFQEDIDKLCQYDWPGNIRELENIIERSIILNEGPLLRIHAFLPAVSISFNQQPLHDESRDSVSLSDNERRHILQALQKTNGTIWGPSGAAALLNIKPSTLAFRIKKLGIKRPSKIRPKLLRKSGNPKIA